MNWIIIPCAIVIHLWAILYLHRLWAMMQSIEYRYLGRTINIRLDFFIPFIGLIFFYSWLIWG